MSGIQNTTSSDKIKPFLRWAGSKRKHVSKLKQFWSDKNERYIEPFCGSSCLFFEIAPNKSILGDNNSDLIELYREVRDNPYKLYRRLLKINRDLSTYNKWRELDVRKLDKNTRALRFLYLNRNCFNGIYRTNLSGQFNVPMGSKLGEYFTLQDLMTCSQLLKKTKLIAGDFQKTLELVREGDFVYMDPPYAMASERRRVFREYTHRSFNILDIPRFEDSLKSIHQGKAHFLVSYADCAESRFLAKRWNSIRVPIKRNIAGFSGSRKLAYEFLISNKEIPSFD